MGHLHQPRLLGRPVLAPSPYLEKDWGLPSETWPYTSFSQPGVAKLLEYHPLPSSFKVLSPPYTTRNKKATRCGSLFLGENLVLFFEWEAEVREVCFCLCLVLCCCYNSDSHSEDILEFFICSFREYAVLFDTECVVTHLVDCGYWNTLEVFRTRKCDVEQAVQEILCARAAESYLVAHCVAY